LEEISDLILKVLMSQKELWVGKVSTVKSNLFIRIKQQSLNNPNCPIRAPTPLKI